MRTEMMGIFQLYLRQESLVLQIVLSSKNFWKDEFYIVWFRFVHLSITKSSIWTAPKIVWQHAEIRYVKYLFKTDQKNYKKLPKRTKIFGENYPETKIATQKWLWYTDFTYLTRKLMCS